MQFLKGAEKKAGASRKKTTSVVECGRGQNVYRRKKEKTSKPEEKPQHTTTPSDRGEKQGATMLP